MTLRKKALTAASVSSSAQVTYASKIIRARMKYLVRKYGTYNREKKSVSTLLVIITYAENWYLQIATEIGFSW